MKLPCGCVMWSEQGVFYIKPCNLNCPSYKYALEQSQQHGNKIEFMEAKEILGGGNL